MSLPTVYNTYQPSGCVYPHGLWSHSHCDVASSVAIEDGDLLIYRTQGDHPNKFNKTGHNNLAVGQRTGNGTGVANIMIGMESGSVYSEETGVSVKVEGTDNIIIGSNAGSKSVLGAYNISLGKDAGKNLAMNTISIGYLAGSTLAGDTPSGSNNIYLNASGDELHSVNNGGCFVKPIREAQVAELGLRNLQYNPITGEIVYDL